MSQLEDDAIEKPEALNTGQDSGKTVPGRAFRLLVAAILLLVLAGVVIASYQSSRQIPHETYGDVHWSVARYTTEKQKALGLLLPISRAIENGDDRGFALCFVASARIPTDRQSALQIAQAVQEPFFRAIALANIAFAQERSDPQGAEALFHQAIQSAQLIQGPERKSFALLRIAYLIGKTRKERAAPIFQQSAVAARTIPDWGVRVQKLVWIAGIWSKEDPEHAIALARTLPPDEREIAFSGIIDDWVYVDPLHASQFALKIKDTNFKQSALRNVACIWSNTDIPNAVRLAHQINDRTQQDSTLEWITKNIVARNYREALNIAQQIHDPASQIRIFVKIAAALWQDKPTVATSTLRQALILARKLHDPDAMKECALELAKTDPKSADAVFRDAIQVQLSKKDRVFFPGQSYNAYALGQIASAQAAIDPERAVQVMESMQFSAYKPSTQRNIAVQWARTNPEKAIRLATSIEAQDQQDATLCEIAALLAKTDPQRACALLARIKDNRMLSHARVEVAAGWALSDPQQAAHFAGTIADPSTKEKALVKVAAAWAGKNYAQAIKFAASLEEAPTQTAAFTAIAATQEQTDPQHADAAYVRAVEAAQGIEDETARDHALLEIAEGWAHIVPVSAVQTVQMIRHDRAKTEAIKRIVSHWVDVVPPYPFLQ